MFKVLIVDDSATDAELLKFILSHSEDLKVIGHARNGEEAVVLAEKLHPDVITMDVMMPGIDGFQTTREIMEKTPTPIVIITSSINSKELNVTFNALDAGALMAIGKPPGPANSDFPAISRQIISTVKNMASLKVFRRWPKKKDTIEKKEIVQLKTKIKIIGIASSTGGPQALHYIFQNLPESFSCPVLIVQHIASGFHEGFTHWLNSVANHRNFKVAVNGEQIKKGNIYLAPENYHLGVIGNKIELSGAEPVNGFRPSANYLFLSLANYYGSLASGVILTGMGRDGVDGIKALTETGGFTIAQDRESSVVFGMPGEAIREKAVKHVLSLKEITKFLADITM